MTRDPHTDALVQALRAPGSLDELADARLYLEMFRAARDDGPTVLGARRRRLFRRIGGGTALAVVLAAGTGGVAAARQGELPDPWQGMAERVLAPVGVVPGARADVPRPRRLPPAPALTHVVPSAPPVTAPDPGDHAAPTPHASPHTSPRTSTSPSPGAEPPRTPPRPDPPAPAPLPGKSGTRGPVSRGPAMPAPPVAPAPVPAPEPAPVAPAAFADLTAPAEVTAGASATITATVVDDAGQPVAGVVVVLEVLGPDGWVAVAATTSDAGGSVSTDSGPVEATTDLRLRAGDVVSSTLTVAVTPVSG